MTARESIEPVRVLLVEDSPVAAHAVMQKLRLARNTVFETTHAIELDSAIMAFSSRHFDIVLLDLTLPGTTGLATLSKFLRRIPSAAILVMSGATDPTIARDAAKLGAEGFFSKDTELSAADLESQISQAIARKMSERSARASRTESAVLRTGGRVSHAFKKPIDDLEHGLYELIAYISREATAHLDAVRQILETNHVQSSIYEMRAVMDATEERVRSTRPPPNDMSMLNSSPDIKPTPALSKRRIGAALHDWEDWNGTK